MTRTTAPASTAIFGLDVAGIIGDALASAGGVMAAVLVVRAPRLRETANPAGGTRATETLIPCEAIREVGATSGTRTASISLVAATALLDGERIVPEVGHAIDLEGERWEIAEVSGDAATALYECKCARAGAGR